MDTLLAILVILLVLALVFALVWYGRKPAAAVIGGAAYALGGDQSIVGGGKRRNKLPAHVYNRQWDTSPKFKLLSVDEVGPQGRPLVVVPYRNNPLQNRAEHLAIFARTLRDRVPSAAILVAEQSDDGRKFNRGQVINAAIAAYEAGEVPELQGFDATHYIINDVDLIPSHGLSDYYSRIPKRGPLHLGVRNRVYEMWGLDEFFGGVNSMTPDAYHAANGFPNSFWGWGGEDKVFRRRFEAAGVPTFRPSVGYVVNVPHAWGKKSGHEHADDLHEVVRVASAAPRTEDGVSQVRYKVVKIRNLADAYEPTLKTPPPMAATTLELQDMTKKTGGDVDATPTTDRYAPFPLDAELPSKSEIWTYDPIFPTGVEVLRETFRTGKVPAAKGHPEIRLSSAVDPREGRHLFDVVRSNGFTRTLEVGLANGVSTLFIAEAAVRNAKESGGKARHVALDPNQITQWKGAGLSQIERAGLAGVVTHVSEDSTTALPRMVKDGERFQFVFVDGMHLYDYTLIDFFFGSRLLEVGGVICVDDIQHPAVRDWLRYARKNYPHLRYVPRTLASKTLATFVKVGEDERKWDFHRGGAHEWFGGAHEWLGGADGWLGGAPSTAREDTHTEALDALAELAKSGEGPTALWVAGPAGIGKTTLGYAAKDIPIEGVAVIDIDQRVMRAMFRKWEITDRDAMTRAFGHTYGFGDDSDLGEKALADFRSALLDELRTKLASHPKVVLLIGPIQAKRRAAFQAAVKEAMGEEAPAFASWLLYPKAKGSILPANISARIASYAKLAQRRKNAPKRPIWMPGSREIIPEPSEDLAKKTPAEIMAAHRALFDKTVPFARKEWGRAEVKAADRVFEV